MPVTVNDAAVRSAFLRNDVAPALARLQPDTPALWGGMRAQEMVEHLLAAVALSTGRLQLDFAAPADAARLRVFLETDMAMPKNYMNPLLVNGLPPLRFPSLAEANAALLAELQRFLDDAGSTDIHAHPIFGPLDHDAWDRVHYKHFRHHLMQFGVLEADTAQ